MEYIPGLKGKVRNLTGQKFGKLTVLSFKDRVQSGKNKKIRWECLCECGNKIVVRGDGLVSGNTKSCGCVTKQKLIQNNLKRRKPLQEKGLKNQLGAYKWEANKRNLKWKLKDSEALKFFQDKCFYCDSPPTGRYVKGGTYYANGIDRKDSSLGYTIENSVPCCTKCNIAKNSMNIKDFYLWLTKVSTSGPIKPIYLFKIKDNSGVSGDGVVAVGGIMPSGKVILEWLGQHKTETIFEDLEQVAKVHSHGGDTIIVVGNPKFHYIFEELGVIKDMVDINNK